MKKRVGLIGLGLMGAPMARNWLKNKFELTILPHKNKSVAVELQALGARVASGLEGLAKDSDVIVLMVPTSVEVESLLIGRGSLENILNAGQLVIDMSTSDPASTGKIYKLYLKKGLRFFDAPVTGGVKGAQEGTLTLLLGGPLPWHQEAQEVLNAVSLIQNHFGDVGKGHLAKIINNYVCIGNLHVFSEILPLASKLGIGSDLIFKTLLSGTGASQMLQAYGPQILEGDFKPRYKLHHAQKDLELAKGVVDSLSIRLPGLEAMIENFKAAKEQGLGEENISALIKVFEKTFASEFRSSSLPIFRY